MEHIALASITKEHVPITAALPNGSTEKKAQ
jgi:hypothetical protein